MLCFCIKLFLLYWCCSVVSVNAYRPGHMKPFGTGPTVPLPTVQGFLDAATFYKDHVSTRRPVKMSGAGRDFPAYSLWSDAYLLSIDITAPGINPEVMVEGVKKEDREPSKMSRMHFHDFLRLYNTTDIYMVQDMPQFLKPDVVLPWPLQCDSWNSSIGQFVTWFSSGGTKSVIHTDSMDNINCVIRGNKSLVLVDPDKFPGVIPLYPNGTYSPVDVDKVDLDKYPAMANLEFFHVDLVPGDCFYIPVKWIHQVRSFGSNLAVNVWFENTLTAPPSGCRDTPDPKWTLDQTVEIGMYMSSVRMNWLQFVEEKGPVDFEIWMKLIAPDSESLMKDIGMGFRVPIFNMFKLLDRNRDYLVDSAELKDIPAQMFKDITIEYHRFIEQVDFIRERHVEPLGGREDL